MSWNSFRILIKHLINLKLNLFYFARKIDEKLGLWDKRNKGIYVSLIEGNSDWHIPQEIAIDDLSPLHEALNEAIKGMVDAIYLMERLDRMSKRIKFGKE